jgi:hypothetical protein
VQDLPDFNMATGSSKLLHLWTYKAFLFLSILFCPLTARPGFFYFARETLLQVLFYGQALAQNKHSINMYGIAC